MIKLQSLDRFIDHVLADGADFPVYLASDDERQIGNRVLHPLCKLVTHVDDLPDGLDSFLTRLRRVADVGQVVIDSGGEVVVHVDLTDV